MYHKVSGCASYVALVAGSEIQVHLLLPPSLLRSYHLGQCFALHRRNRLYTQTPHLVETAAPEVALIEWEVPQDGKSTKLAAYAHTPDLHAVVVLDLGHDSPIVIEQDLLGVQAMQWVPALTGNSTGTGAYIGCTQICVFTALGLEMRLYSLDCTHVLFTVPKPLHSRIYMRPGTSNVWSVVATPYYEKNLSQRSILADSTSLAPVLLHFYNEGSVSKVLATLPLDCVPASDFDWSASGKWLLCFDSALGKFSLQVLNLLALHTHPEKIVTRHKAQPTALYTYSGVPQNCSHWVCSWISINGDDYVVATTSDSAQTLTFRAYDITHMTVSRTSALVLSTAPVWILARSGTQALYRRVLGFPSLSLIKWRVAFSEGNHILIVTDRLAVLIVAKKDCPISFEIELMVSASLEFLTAQLLPHGQLLWVFSDHAAVQTSSGIEVLATSRYLFSEAKITVKRSKENEDQPEGIAVVTMVEQTASGPVWRQINYQVQGDNADDSNMEIMRKYGYTEESSKVVHLMQDVQHSEWVQGKRALQEPTDTFQAKRKA